MPDATTIAQAGLQGWREKVADAVADPVAERSPLEADHVRALISVLFVGLSISYLVKTLKAARGAS